jgi:hypothetical protein
LASPIRLPLYRSWDTCNSCTTPVYALKSPVITWYTDEKAVDELGAVGRTKLSCRSFRAFTVLLIGMLALGARCTPEMYTIGVNPLSELLNAHVTSWWLLFLIIISVLTFTDPARTSSDTPPVLVSARSRSLGGAVALKKLILFVLFLAVHKLILYQINQFVPRDSLKIL